MDETCCFEIFSGECRLLGHQVHGMDCWPVGLLGRGGEVDSGVPVGGAELHDGPDPLLQNQKK